MARVTDPTPKLLVATSCPLCGRQGRIIDQADDATIIYRRPTCVQCCVGLDDRELAFPLFFGSDGRVYL